jgi:hypothetical protein
MIDTGTIKADIEECRLTITALEASRKSNSQRIAALAKERDSSLLPARAAQDEAALAKLHQVDSEIRAIQREDGYDAAAFLQANETLSRLEAQLQRSEHDNKRDAVVASMKSRLAEKAEARIAGLLNQLEKEVSALRAQNKSIAQMARVFLGDNPLELQSIDAEDVEIAELIAFRFVPSLFAYYSAPILGAKKIEDLAEQRFKPAIGRVESKTATAA